MPCSERAVGLERGDGSFAGTFCPPLLNPDRDTPSAVTGPGSKTAVKRYKVYRNTVTVSLINALVAIFPATERITGSDFFRAMARFHIRANPPRSPLLFEYGGGFPDFIEQYEYARQLPWLADVARIERAWLDAYHAADMTPLRADVLASIAPERLSDIVFSPHAATRIVRSRFSALSLFAANRSDETVGTPVEPDTPEDALITRPELEVVARRLPPGGASFLESLISGHTLADAATAAFAEEALFDLPANIAGMLEAGAFTMIEDRNGQ
jgi:hypothetical protein